jgi:hypothetical protein
VTQNIAPPPGRPVIHHELVQHVACRQTDHSFEPENQWPIVPPIGRAANRSGGRLALLRIVVVIVGGGG